MCLPDGLPASLLTHAHAADMSHVLVRCVSTCAASFKSTAACMSRETGRTYSRAYSSCSLPPHVVHPVDVLPCCRSAGRRASPSCPSRTAPLSSASTRPSSTLTPMSTRRVRGRCLRAIFLVWCLRPWEQCQQEGCSSSMTLLAAACFEVLGRTDGCRVHVLGGGDCVRFTMPQRLPPFRCCRLPASPFSCAHNGTSAP